MSIHIGPARANRKPVLQLISPDGETFGFGKLGTGPLTQRLVKAETARAERARHGRADQAHRAEGAARRAVARAAGADPVGAAGLAAAGPAHRAPADRRDARHRRVLRLHHRDAGRERVLGRAARAAGRRSRDRAEGAALASAAEMLAHHAGDRNLRYGAWHGDWAPWNMANLADALLVWDWERFATGVPVGFDAVHHELQRRIQTTDDAAGAVEATVRKAAELLAAVRRRHAGARADRAALPGRPRRPLPDRSPGRGGRPAGRARDLAAAGADPPG